MNLFELHGRLLETAGVSGCERKTAALIKELAAPFADEVWIDTPGNVIARRKGKGKKALVSAHMDVVGFVARGADKDGFVWLTRVGGADMQFCWNRLLRFEGGTLGTLRHVEGKEHEFSSKKVSDITEDDYYCDIGAQSREEALGMVRVGECCVWRADRTLTEDGVLFGPYSDDLFGCCLLLQLLEELAAGDIRAYDLYAAFTVREEISGLGALVAANQVTPDIGIAVDVTTAWDAPDNKPPFEDVIKMGGGPVLTVRDALLIADAELNDDLNKTAQSLGFQCQRGFSKGATDASSFQGAGSGVASVNLSVPQRYLHSAEEMLSMADGEKIVALLKAYLSLK